MERISLGKRIDSNNADDILTDLQDQIDESADKIVLDASDLQYISSAGLRILIVLKKTGKDIELVNASDNIKDLVQMTGIDTIVNVI